MVNREASPSAEVKVSRDNSKAATARANGKLPRLSLTLLILPLYPKPIARVRRRRRKRKRRRVLKLRPDANALGRLLLQHMLDPTYACQVPKGD